MIDVLELIYNKLMTNSFIVANCKDRIKYYSYPETADVKKPFIVIDPLDSEPLSHASDVNHYRKHLVQINVETTNRKLTKQIQNEIRKEMYSLNFGQLAQGLDEFFNETKRYVDARRYKAIIKTDEWSVD